MLKVFVELNGSMFVETVGDQSGEIDEDETVEAEEGRL